LEVEGERGITMVIGLFELRAIALEMEGIKTPRPMTHDLMKNIIDEAGLALSEITITELRDNTFYAVLSLGPYEIDARPSDAIALALRCNTPIFISEEVMQEVSGAGQFTPSTELRRKSAPPSQAPKALPKPLTKLEELKARLEEARQKEDFESCAKLRDEIRKLQSGS